jgi:hypothetical protein
MNKDAAADSPCCLSFPICRREPPGAEPGRSFSVSSNPPLSGVSVPDPSYRDRKRGQKGGWYLQDPSEEESDQWFAFSEPDGISPAHSARQRR